MAPAGTVAVNEVAVAAVTFAFTPPINTILLACVALKFVPVIVTVVPTGPDTGEKELIAGCAKLCNDIHTVSKKRTRLFSRKSVLVTGLVFIDWVIDVSVESR